MWSSLQEFVPAVLKRWWATVPGVALGLWSLVGLFRATPQLAAWVWLAVFGFGLMLATFLAFHQARTARDDAISRADQEELASFRLVGKPKWSVTDAFPYNLEAGRLETIPEPEHWKGNPEINFYLAADFQAMAHGGTNGGYLYDIRCSVLNLPAALVATVPAIPEDGIVLHPRQHLPFKPPRYLPA